MTRLETIIRSDPDLMGLLEYLREVALPQWRLVSGCLYQTVWNVLTRRPRGTGIQDFDVIYFDAGDLSWEAEDAVIRRVTATLPLQIRNQARVHLWYEQHFGVPYAPLRCADEVIDPLSRDGSGGRRAIGERWPPRHHRAIWSGRCVRHGDAAQPGLPHHRRRSRRRRRAPASIWPEVTVADRNAA